MTKLKHLLMLLAAGMLAISCSKASVEDIPEEEGREIVEESPIKYDEVKGYLVNIESVKHGFVGRWDGYSQSRKHESDGNLYVGPPRAEVLATHYTYTLAEEEGKFYITSTLVVSPSYSLKGHIALLTKTQLKLSYDNGGSATYTRITAAPTP